MARSVETKVKASTYGALAASFGIALLNALAGDSELLGGLPPWLQFVLLLVIPSAVTWLAGFATPSKTSTVSEGYRPSVR
jgi:hypothetical protein